MNVMLDGPLLLENLTDEIDRLTQDFVAYTIEEQPQPPALFTRIIIPTGFVTDYCSVPNIPFVHELLGDIGKRAGLVHDYLYSKIVGVELRARGRAWADRVLYYGLRAQGISAWKAELMWAAVRLAGGFYFQGPPGAELELESDQAPADPRGLPNY